jgi:hypothetical protein
VVFLLVLAAFFFSQLLPDLLPFFIDEVLTLFDEIAFFAYLNSPSVLVSPS